MKKGWQKYTLRDVAQEAKVSVGTISNYLNNPDRVKLANRERIEKAIQLLEFTPNVNARILATGVSKNVVLYVLSERLISPTTWLHQLPSIQTICDELFAAGYNMQMSIVYADNLQDTYANVCRCVEGKGADGILLLSVWEISETIIDYLLAKQFPFVAAGSYVRHADACCVFFDNAAVMRDLVDILVDNGHRRIGYIGVRSGQQDVQRRFLGYAEEMRRWNLPIKDGDVLYGDFSISSGHSAMRDALEAGWKCTAALCSNDNMAVGALKALEEAGLSIPGDVSVAGVDNSIAAEAYRLKLDTVQFDLKELGRIAVKQLLTLMSGEEVKEKKMVAGYQIIRGETIGKAKG